MITFAAVTLPFSLPLFWQCTPRGKVLKLQTIKSNKCFVIIRVKNISNLLNPLKCAHTQLHSLFLSLSLSPSPSLFLLLKPNFVHLCLQLCCACKNPFASFALTFQQHPSSAAAATSTCAELFVCLLCLRSVFFLSSRSLRLLLLRLFLLQISFGLQSERDVFFPHFSRK